MKPVINIKKATYKFPDHEEILILMKHKDGYFCLAGIRYINNNLESINKQYYLDHEEIIALNDFTIRAAQEHPFIVNNTKRSFCRAMSAKTQNINSLSHKNYIAAIFPLVFKELYNEVIDYRMLCKIRDQFLIWCNNNWFLDNPHLIRGPLFITGLIGLCGGIKSDELLEWIIRHNINEHSELINRVEKEYINDCLETFNLKKI